MRANLKLVARVVLLDTPNGRYLNNICRDLNIVTNKCLAPKKSLTAAKELLNSAAPFDPCNFCCKA